MASDSQIQYTQNILDQMPRRACNYQVLEPIGHGTFSTVFHIQPKEHFKDDPGYLKDLAIKHITPTSHPDRIFAEVKYMSI